MTNELMSDKSKREVVQLKRTSRRRMKQEEKEKRSKSEVKPPQSTKQILFSRLSATALKVLIFIGVIFIVAILGLIIGFGVIGDGNPIDALNWSTWQHMLDIINGKE